MGTLGSGNHYLEVQEVTEVYDLAAAEAFGLREGAIEVNSHCGSRGLGRRIGTEYLKRMAVSAAGHGIRLPDREARLRPHRLGPGPRLPGRHARGGELRAGQPSDHHPPGAQGVR